MKLRVLMKAQSEPFAGAWIRGNIRPLTAIWTISMGAVIVLGVTGIVLPFLAWICGTIAILFFVAALFLGLWQSSPRLEYREGIFFVRLSPQHRHAVPMAAVECFFLGSQHIGPQSDSSQQDEIKPGHRTSTVVMRIAERETSLQERKTFEPWGSWKSGAVVFQGLWCEPIDLEFVKKLNIKLSEVKKDQSGIPPISIESSCHEALL